LYVIQNDRREPDSLPRARPLGANESNMKKVRPKPSNSSEDLDTMRPEYDFSGAVRGVTARRYAEGVNIVLLDPDVAEIFPDARAVNEALRTLARLRRPSHRRKGRRSA